MDGKKKKKLAVEEGNNVACSGFKITLNIYI